MKYHFKIYREKGGFWAECIELKGCMTQGNSLSELRSNMQDALNLYLQEPETSNSVFPVPRKVVKAKEVEAVPVDPSIAFAISLRAARIHHKMTQMQAAKRLGLKNLYSYQRLESARTANPALKTIARVKTVFPELVLDEVV